LEKINIVPVRLTFGRTSRIHNIHTKWATPRGRTELNVFDYHHGTQELEETTRQTHVEDVRELTNNSTATTGGFPLDLNVYHEYRWETVYCDCCPFRNLWKGRSRFILSGINTMELTANANFVQQGSCTVYHRQLHRILWKVHVRHIRFNRLDQALSLIYRAW